MGFEGMLVAILIFLAVVIITMLAGVIFLGYRLVKAYPIVSDPAAPGSVKAVFWLAILYTISPIDILPDPILIDDMMALLGAFAHISKKGSELGLGRPEMKPELSGFREPPELGADRPSNV